MAIRGVTFDFWATLYGQVHPPHAGPYPHRLMAISTLLERHGHDAREDRIIGAFEAAERAFDNAWREGRAFTARDRARHVLESFGLTPQEEPLAAAALELEDAGRHAELRLAPGAREAISALAARGIKLGVVSDAATTPGRVLREFMERDGLLSHFAGLSFSDETGYCKPRTEAFQTALTAMGVLAAETVHVGDIPRTDVAGAKELGMRTVRFAGLGDRPGPPEANAVIRDHRELLALLERW